MTGGALLGLVLLSMAWLYALTALGFNWYAFAKRHTRPLALVPGVAASLAVFFSLPALDPPWPWLWVLLPLALDPYNPPLSWLIRRLPGKS